MGSKTAVRERKPEAVAPVEAGACRHHWIIDTPQGALSSGRCKRCGEEREFRNSANDYIWDGDSSSRGYGRLGGVRSTPKPVAEDEMTADSGSGRSDVAHTL
jgi:hypothetical protein